MNTRRTLLAGALAALLSGCATSLELGPGATIAQVEAQLGRPKVVHDLPDGVRQYEFNYVRGPFTYMVFTDASGKVTEYEQVLRVPNFRQIGPGTTRQQVLLLIGHPSEVARGGRNVGETWTYRFQNVECQWFQVRFEVDNQTVASAATTMMPQCMNAPS